jgi:hypothetical protein
MYFFNKLQHPCLEILVDFSIIAENVRDALISGSSVVLNLTDQINQVNRINMSPLEKIIGRLTWSGACIAPRISIKKKENIARAESYSYITMLYRLVSQKYGMRGLFL